jgi:hypothetical protein
MELKEYVLKHDWTFRSNSRRRKSYPAGTKLLVEVEVLSSKDSKMELKNYYIYSQPNIILGFFPEEEFNELFMTLEESRKFKINKIIKEGH